MVGGELVMEFRRTLGIGSRTESLENPYANTEWASDNIVGRGWSSNIGSRVIQSRNPDHEATEAEYHATVAGLDDHRVYLSICSGAVLAAMTAVCDAVHAVAQG